MLERQDDGVAQLESNDCPEGHTFSSQFQKRETANPDMHESASRRKERKKYGQKGARARFQFSKR